VKVAERLTGRSYGATFRGGLRHYSLLQMNYSRPESATVGYINETHEDGSLVTFTSVTAPGLEIQTADGAFLPVVPSAARMLVMPGEILSLLTGRRILPMLHRVLPIRSVAERMSLLFFADLDPPLCRPWVVNETNRGVDIGELVRANPLRFGLSKWATDTAP